MTEHIHLRCPVCEQSLVAVADIPMLRQLSVSCPFCAELLVSIILERNQPRNPYSHQRPEDPQGWRVQSVLAGQREPEPAIAGGEPHLRRSRRQARRRKRRHG